MILGWPCAGFARRDSSRLNVGTELPPPELIPLLLRFACLLLHQFHGFQVVVDVLVLATLDRTVRSMRDAPEIFHKNCINPQNCILVALTLHYVAHGQRPDIPAVLEITRIESMGPHLVDNLATIGPGREQP